MSHRPRKRFGQNFLHDAQVLEQIVTAIALEKGDQLLEIGPGQGALTTELLAVIDHLSAVEIDRDLVAELHSHFSDKRLTLYSGDILKFDLYQIPLTPQQKLRIIGNLPYNISTPLLFHLLQQRQLIEDMHFMLQQEVADRMVATPGSGSYGRLGIMVSYHCKVEKLFTVPPSAFNPSPKVYSAVVRLTPHSTRPLTVKSVATLEQVVSSAFNQRRKTIRNSLKKLISASTIEAIGIDPSQRPERLSLSQFAQLADAIDE